MHVDTTTATFTRDELDQLLQVVYDAGQCAERDRVSTGLAELDQLRLAPPAISPQDRIAARVVEMDAHAAAINARLGRPADYLYQGGPVAWDVDADEL